MFVTGSTALTYKNTWLHRIFIRFQSEDPWNYAKRVADAFYSREATEAHIRYALYIDCMPVNEVPDMDGKTMAKITNWASSSLRIENCDR